jgi:hypothetical protein
MDDGCCYQGFRLHDPEVDDVVRAARDLVAGAIEPDTEAAPEDNVALLLRAARLLQLGLEVQYSEAEDLLADNNSLRDALRAAEERSRSLTAEVAELREARDAAASGNSDAHELELELKVRLIYCFSSPTGCCAMLGGHMADT